MEKEDVAVATPRAALTASSSDEDDPFHLVKDLNEIVSSVPVVLQNTLI